MNINDLINISIIHYASVLPGAGKTHWAIKALSNKIKNREGITLYVGPTIALLKEVYSGIRKELPRELRSSVHLVEHSKHLPSTNSRVQLLVSGGVDSYGTEHKPEPEGTVILCTHETFTLLPHNYTSYSIGGEPAFKNRDKVSVIFDEARKCTVSEEKITLPYDMATALLRDYFSVDLDDGTAPIAKAPHRYKPVTILKGDTAELDALMSKNLVSRQARRSVLNMITVARNATVKLFAFVEIKQDADDSKRKIVFQTLRIPHLLFSGWKQVLLLSAFFETSQMYHLLKRRELFLDRRASETASEYKSRLTAYALKDSMVRLVDVTNKIVNKRRMEKLQDRYRATSVTYVSPSSKVSKTKLEKGLMVSSEGLKKMDLAKFANEYRDLVAMKRDEANVIKSLPLRVARNMHLLAEKNQITPSEVDLKIFAHLKTLPGLTLHYTPLQWYASAALHISNAWYKKQGLKVKPLPITCNVGHGEFSREIDAVLPKGAWREMPLYSQGLNEFQHYDTIAFLASLNPTPEAKKFLSQLCPTYSPDLDFTLDQCVQSAARCSVRNTDSKSKVLIIVTDKELALMVRKHLGDLPSIINPKEFNFPLKEPIVVHTRNSGAKRAAAYSKNPATKAKLAYIHKNSKYSKTILALRTWLRRNSKLEGTLKYNEKAAELKSLRVKFSRERPLLIAQYYETQE